ncbi:MAG: RNA polymerase sigma factor [Bryobacteraceae bacterium]
MLVSTPVEPEAADIDLVRTARNGDRAAFGGLYSRYRRMVHGVLIAHVPHADAEDLLHDVFVRAMRLLPALRDPAAFGAWLAAIARNLAADHHRRNRQTVEVTDRNCGASRQNVSDQSEAERALRALRLLPPAYRETLILRLVEGLTGPEIAARTGLTPDSVRVNLCRGMKLLRAQLQGGTDYE